MAIDVAAPLLLLTGPPGVGKTTLVRRVAALLGDRRISGFTTDELRSHGERVGFRIVPFGGEKRTLAHVDFHGCSRVGRYGVDVAAIDATADAALAPNPTTEFYLIDEIGKMECFSERFVTAMGRLFEGIRPVAATVARSGGGFIAEVKRRPEAELWEVTRQNREAMVQQVADWVLDRLGSHRAPS